MDEWLGLRQVNLYTHDHKTQDQVWIPAGWLGAWVIGNSLFHCECVTQPFAPWSLTPDLCEPQQGENSGSSYLIQEVGIFHQGRAFRSRKWEGQLRPPQPGLSLVALPYQ